MAYQRRQVCVCVGGGDHDKGGWCWERGKDSQFGCIKRQLLLEKGEEG